MTQTLTTERSNISIEDLRIFLMEVNDEIGSAHPETRDTKISARLLRDIITELIANREAQPVGWRYRYRRGPHKGKWIYVDNKSECTTRPFHEMQELFTAPPAPAVPETPHSSVIAEQLAHVLSCMEVTDHQRAIISCAVDRLDKAAEVLQQNPTALTAPAVPDISALTELIVDRLIDCSAADDDSIADAETFVYNACRAAMLAQPVIPVEPTANMQAAGAAAIRFDTTPINKLFTANAVYRAMLATAPTQGENQ